MSDVTAFDNSNKHRIQQLSIFLYGDNGTINIDLDGRHAPEITILVIGNETSWALDALSTAEEQVERLLQSHAIARIPPHIKFLTIAFFGLLGLTTLLVLLLARSIPTESRQLHLRDRMWLNSNDIKEVTDSLNRPGVEPTSVLLDIHKRQISNIMVAAETKQPQPTIDKQTIFAIIPAALIVACLAYLFIASYPRAVFYWGDAIEWYDSIVARRKFIWTGIVIAFVVGVLVNLATTGLN
ncbi:hypothetical protein [Sorangium cellulosum]|nr:hypothetical protein [Sorangium cellulosum]